MMAGLFQGLRNDLRGSVAIEFALIGPALFGMLLGVLHIGIGMQNYNALRSVSGDVARFAVVNYQTRNRLSASQLENYASGRASQAPYGLQRSRFDAHMVQAANQRVGGAVEYTLQLTYMVPTLLGVIGIDEFPITYTRPVFVIAAPPATG